MIVRERISSTFKLVDFARNLQFSTFTSKFPVAAPVVLRLQVDVVVVAREKRTTADSTPVDPRTRTYLELVLVTRNMVVVECRVGEPELAVDALVDCAVGWRVAAVSPERRGVVVTRRRATASVGVRWAGASAVSVAPAFNATSCGERQRSTAVLLSLCDPLAMTAF